MAVERTIVMPHNTVHTIFVEAGDRIACNQGLAWITFDGEPGDILIRGGQIWSATGRGTVVAQPLGTAATCQVLAILEPRTSPATRLVASMRRLLAARPTPA